jgi:serine/threonine protein kinase
VKLIDFGMAQMLGQPSLGGTPLVKAPETLVHPCTTRPSTDVFGLGSEMLVVASRTDVLSEWRGELNGRGELGFDAVRENRPYFQRKRLQMLQRLVASAGESGDTAVLQLAAVLALCTREDADARPAASELLEICRSESYERHIESMMDELAAEERRLAEARAEEERARAAAAEAAAEAAEEAAAVCGRDGGWVQGAAAALRVALLGFVPETPAEPEAAVAAAETAAAEAAEQEAAAAAEWAEAEQAAPPAGAEQRIAAFECTAQEAGELTLLEGDVIEVEARDASGWWMGLNTRTGERGQFLENHTCAA